MPWGITTDNTQVPYGIPGIEPGLNVFKALPAVPFLEPTRLFKDNMDKNKNCSEQGFSKVGFPYLLLLLCSSFLIPQYENKRKIKEDQRDSIRVQLLALYPPHSWNPDTINGPLYYQQSFLSAEPGMVPKHCKKWSTPVPQHIKIDFRTGQILKCLPCMWTNPSFFTWSSEYKQKQTQVLPL